MSMDKPNSTLAQEYSLSLWDPELRPTPSQLCVRVTASHCVQTSSWKSSASSSCR